MPGRNAYELQFHSRVPPGRIMRRRPGWLPEGNVIVEQGADTPIRRQGRRRQRRFLIAGLLILAGLAYLAFTVTKASAVYYLTVPELYARGAAASQRPVRVSGIVDAGSIQKDSSTFETRFTASDGAGTLPVLYKGPVPDMFQPGIQVVV